VFEDGYADQRHAGPDIDQRQIQSANGPALPERFNIPDIGMKGGIFNPGISASAQMFPLCNSFFAFPLRDLRREGR
jgi:hypothetical protein